MKVPTRFAVIINCWGNSEIALIDIQEAQD